VNLDDLPRRLAGDLQATADEITMETQLEDIPEYDSMGRLVVLAMLDGHYGVLVSAEELEQCVTVADLAALIQQKRSGGA
jgi:acyl carrier protein